MATIGSVMKLPARRVHELQRDLADQLQLLLAGLLATSLSSYLLLSLLNQDWRRFWYLLPGCAVVLLCLVLTRLAQVYLASILLLGAGLGLTLWFQLVRGPGTRLSYLALVFVAIAWLALGSRGGLFYAVLVGLSTLVLVGRRLTLAGPLERELSADIAGFLATLVGLSVVLWLFTRLLQRAYERAVEQERRSQEYAVAQSIQQRLLPREVPQPEIGAVVAWCEPAQEISGDFYDVIRLSRGRLGLVVGDVCGKGLPAALLMNLARTTLRAESAHSASAALTLSRVSAALAHGLDRRQFIALLYAIFDARSCKLRIANAGQLEPLLLRGSRVHYLSSPGERLPLGMELPRRYDELVVQLQPGDRVLFYTDGLLEAQNASNELFGFERLEQQLLRLQPGASAVARLRRELGRFTGGAGSADDVTVVELDLSAARR